MYEKNYKTMFTCRFFLPHTSNGSRAIKGITDRRDRNKCPTRQNLVGDWRFLFHQGLAPLL